MRETFLNGCNAKFIEQLYADYLADPSQLMTHWQDYFAQLTASVPAANNLSSTASFMPQSRAEPSKGMVGKLSSPQQIAVLQLINAYRFLGHRNADLDPLRQSKRPEVAELDLAHYCLSAADLDTIFNTGSLFAPDNLPLKKILEIVQTTYCGRIATEYMNINETQQKRWIQERLEACCATPEFSDEKKRHILEKLTAANVLEEYLHQKYPGQKRFSLEGGESVIPMLEELIHTAGSYGTQEIVIGMAHRGRLNVLVNCLGKLPSDLFNEFEGKSVQEITGSGDVKYHMGYSSDVQTAYGGMHLTLAFNPSHLEIVAPVVEGSVRARQQRRDDSERKQVLPVIIHGDSAFAGQGVVMETLNLSQTRGYGTGGTVHIIINNQIGFTTSDPLDARSTLYCTDVAKMVQAPIFHVNADDPEAVVWVTKLALDFRMVFKKDVVIDVVCYRRHGHSETDEPSATQPMMYQHIRAHAHIREIYADALQQQGIITAADKVLMVKNYIDSIETNQLVAGELDRPIDRRYFVNYAKFIGQPWRQPLDTGINAEKLSYLAARLTTFPEKFVIHRSVARIVKARQRMAQGEIPVDWGFAENMAYASLIQEGASIRLSGQDSGRGTFFHRHAVVHNQTDGSTYLPLQHIQTPQASVLIINSILSEEAVLAYEYGYAISDPNTLVIWEAQFGDFANVAQVIFDQFISSCEAKWGRCCGLTVFLPHGHDGQGPEHSSARLERYLQLCAQDNIQICVPSSAAQMFHMLRRQVLRQYRKPLIVMTPKSLLRQKISASPLSALQKGHFEVVKDEIDALNKQDITRCLLCTGKIYYDLLQARRKADITHIAIVRIEQLYPFPDIEIQQILQAYVNLQQLVWVQEEPRNQGAWRFINDDETLLACLPPSLSLAYVGRPSGAASAAGYMQVHLAEQQEIVQAALQLA